MVRGLNEVCLTGDVAALKRWHAEDPLILDTAAAASSSIEHVPLHIAALGVHVDLVREILRVKPELAHQRNTDGSYPLHLAAANGHRQVVEELLKADADLSLLPDGNGHLPLHTAVLEGRSDVMKAPIHANKESARELTGHGESVLHLDVQSNNFESVRSLVESPDLGEDKGFLNMKEEGDNTILHAATARRQSGTVELLTRAPGVEVNARNRLEATALDVLQPLPCPEEGDLLVGSVLSDAGGRTTRHGNPMQPGNGHGGSNPPTAPETGVNPDQWFTDINTTWVVVALAMGTLAYQAVLQPPGGFTQAGKAVLAGSSEFTMFTAFNTGVFFASMSLILLPLCVPLHRRCQLITTVLLWIMRIVVFCTLLTFSFAAFAIYPDDDRARCFVLWAWVILIFGISVMLMQQDYFHTTYLSRCFPRRITTPTTSGDNTSLLTDAAGECNQFHVNPTTSHSIEVNSPASSGPSGAELYCQSQSDARFD